MNSSLKMHHHLVAFLFSRRFKRHSQKDGEDRVGTQVRKMGKEREREIGRESEIERERGNKQDACAIGKRGALGDTRGTCL